MNVQMYRWGMYGWGVCTSEGDLRASMCVNVYMCVDMLGPVLQLTWPHVAVGCV